MSTDSQATRDEIVTTRLETETVERLREYARLQERTVSSVLRLAVREYLDARFGK